MKDLNWHFFFQIHNSLFFFLLHICSSSSCTFFSLSLFWS